MTTALQIITNGLKDAGLVELTGTPSSDQQAVALERLNNLINMWVVQGLKLWLLEDIAIPLTLGQTKYVLSPTGDVVMPRPLRIEFCYYKGSTGYQRPLNILSWQGYKSLSQVNVPGSISGYFVDKQATHTDVYVWNPPDSLAITGTVQAVTRKQVTNFTGVSDTMAFPQEWALALEWGLADELSTGQPQAIMDRAEKRAAAYRQALEDFEVEDTQTTFEPDPQAYQRGGFR